MGSDLVIGLDIGTTGCKAVAVDVAGRIVATSQKARGAHDYPLHQPCEDWAQQRVEEIWPQVAGALRLVTSRVDRARIAAIGLSGAMHSMMPVDRRGRPMLEAMTWADNRALPEAAQLRKRADLPTLYCRTGCPLQWQYHPAKLLWLRRHQPRTFRQAACFVGIKDWVLHRLTSGDRWITDVCIASSTGLLNLSRRAYDEEALALAGVDAARLPAPNEPDAEAGLINAAAAKETGLPRDIPVYPGGSDGGMAILGAGVSEPNHVVITIGTSGAVRLTTTRPRLDPKQRTFCYAVTRDLFFAGGPINNGGLAAQWLRDVCFSDLPMNKRYGRLFEEAAGVAPGADGVLFLPYLTGERCPHWRADLTASFLGLTARHTRAHLARAVLEGVAFCLADVWGALRIDPAIVKSAQLTGGITRSKLWRQIVADVLGVPLKLNETADASALGAAVISARGAGLIKVNATFGPDRGTRAISPIAAHIQRYRDLHRAFAAKARFAL